MRRSPAPWTGRWTARELGVGAAGTVLVAVHPWDVDGAARAGCGSAYPRRDGAPPHPAPARPPDHVVTAVGEPAAVLPR